MPKLKKRKKVKIKPDPPVEILFYNKQLKDGLRGRQWSPIKMKLFKRRKIHCMSYEDMLVTARWLASRFHKRKTLHRRGPKRITSKHNPFMGSPNKITIKQLLNSYNNSNTTNISVTSHNIEYIYTNLPLTETKTYLEENYIVTELNNITVDPLNSNDTALKKELNIYDCSFNVSNITCYSSSVLQ